MAATIFLLADQLEAGGAPSWLTPCKEIDQGADKVRKENDENPDNLIIAFRRLVPHTINNHPDPED
jgi:hypothetical protein